MVTDKQIIPIRAVVVYLKLAWQNGLRVDDFDRIEVKLAGESGDVGGSNVPEGSGGSEK